MNRFFKFSQWLLAAAVVIAATAQWGLPGLALGLFSAGLTLSPVRTVFGMSWEIGTTNTGDALATMSPESVRILWQQTVDVFAQQADFWKKYEGESKDNAISVISDTSVGKGLKFRVTSMAGFYNKGKSGDGLFVDQDDFAKIVINNNELAADYVRNAYSVTRRTDEYMGMRNELRNGSAIELGKWMGRELSARCGMTWVLKGGSENLMFGGGKTAESELLSADGLVLDDIMFMGQALKPMGGVPCEIATRNSTPVYKYCVVGTTPGLFSLKTSDDYKAAIKDAMPRENYDANPLWAGGYADIDGHRIDEFNPIDGDGYAWAGSWFNAKAYTGAAITAGTAAFAIKGGGSAAAAATPNIEFFRFFPNFAFEFLPNDIYVPGSTTQYLLIVNPRGAVTAANPDPGKVGMYAYTTGNDGTQITITQRLAPVQNGPVALVTVGDVTWNTGVWAVNGGMHSQTHPIGSTVVLCNEKGVPIGDTIMFGKMAMLRGYGEYRNKRDQWDVDGNFETRNYITTVFGQQLRKNVNDKYPGYVRLRHAISYPELGLPQVTS